MPSTGAPHRASSRGCRRVVDLAEGRRYRAKEMPNSSPIGRVSAAAGGRVPALRTSLRRYYDSLFAAYGPQHWWPGRTDFEIIVGAILTQNTSWSNVEIAMRNLRREKLLMPRAIERISFARLAQLIRSSGYFRQKAKKLKCF